MTTPLDDDELTALFDPDIPRIDLVGKGANGIPRFLVAKQADESAGLMDPDFIRDLIAKAEPEPQIAEEQVTMTGSPAAIVKLIHQAARRPEPLAKAKYDAADRKHAAATGAAMDDGSYPIENRDDLNNAIHAVGRGGADHDAIRRHIIRRARSLGASSAIPDNWTADGSLTGAVAKELDMTDLDPTMMLADPEMTAPGMATTPGSPAWEAIDAATACKWTAILARAKAAVDLLADREMLEAAAGDEGDAMQACDLQDACCAIDYAISVLAPFAVAEQAEADAGDQMAAVGKALAGWDPAPLDVIESLGVVRKAGRVLSAQNEAAIRGAVDSLQKVLASLPAAPVVKDVAAQPVADEKETAMPHTTTSAETVAEAGQQPQMGVAKADEVKPPMVAVYDAQGTLVGVVDPADITSIAGAQPKNDEPTEAPDDTTQTPDLTPAPAAEVGTPADAVDDGVAKQTSDTSDVLKGIADVVKAQFDAYSATQAQTLAEQAKALAAVTETLNVLKGQVHALEEQPAESKVFTNGAVPPAHLLRGQNQGAVPVDVAKAQEMKRGLYGGAAGEQQRIADEMQKMAIAQLQAIHQGHAR